MTQTAVRGHCKMDTHYILCVFEQRHCDVSDIIFSLGLLYEWPQQGQKQNDIKKVVEV